MLFLKLGVASMFLWLGTALAGAPSFPGVVPEDRASEAPVERAPTTEKAPRSGEKQGCGLTPEVVPDFTLEDVNPNSATFGSEYSRDEQLGQAMVIYWANAS